MSLDIEARAEDCAAQTWMSLIESCLWMQSPSPPHPHDGHQNYLLLSYKYKWGISINCPSLSNASPGNGRVLYLEGGDPGLGMELPRKIADEMGMA